MSTPARPKQLLPLATDSPLLVDTLDRLAPLVPAERTLILTNGSLRAAVRAAVPRIADESVIAEPRPAGTAAALAWAASEIRRRDDADPVMLCVHADWSVADGDGFRRALAGAAAAAVQHRALITVGITPTRPDPGFGYIEPGDVVEGDTRTVRRFIEKPDRATAERYVAMGYLWNSGIFAWRVVDFLDEIAAHTPEVWPALVNAGNNAERFFAEVRSVSVDIGVLERSRRVLVRPGDFGWDDVGTWAALARVRPLDVQQNARHGDTVVIESANNVVHAEGGTVVLYGVSDLVVIARDGVTLVTTTELAADLKTLLDELPPPLRDLA